VKPVLRRFLLPSAAVLFTLAITLVLVEGLLRIYCAVKPNVDVEFYRYASLMKGSVPGSDVKFMHRPSSRERFFGVDVEINSAGFRDAESLNDKPDGSARLVLLGDSITFGWGVPYGERFSEILERHWMERQGRPFEIVNTGHGNYNSVQELALLREKFSSSDVDGVLQVWYINDAEPTPEHREPPWYSRLYLSIFLWSKTDLLSRRLGARESYVDYYRNLYEPEAPGMLALERALAETGRWAAERNLPWVFVVLPEFHGFARGGAFEGICSKVGRLAAEGGATVVDAREAFRDTDPAAVWVAYNDVHPNSRGHSIIASAILEAVDPAIFHSRPEPLPVSD
jgi:hypothetical protein